MRKSRLREDQSTRVLPEVAAESRGRDRGRMSRCDES